MRKRGDGGGRDADDASEAHDEPAAVTEAAKKPAILEWYARAAERVRLGLDPFRSD